MIVYTDSVEFARQVLIQKPDWENLALSSPKSGIDNLAEVIFHKSSIHKTFQKSNQIWNYLLIAENALHSQYDTIINICRENQSLPGGIICLAGSGRGFHGHRNRKWISQSGNIHLTVFFAPHQVVEHYGIGFTILSAVSVLQAVDDIEGLKNRAVVKWVNDILIDNAKICGVLAYTQTQGNIITGAVLGIGLNVEFTPEVEPTPFVPEVSSLSDFLENHNGIRQDFVLDRLIYHLDRNYQLLINNRYSELLDFYRQRSVIIGKRVDIYSDHQDGEGKDEIISGRVTGIGKNLELFLEGIKKPVIRGRLVLSD